ncbi:MAG: hypothetical protein AB9880_05860 [Christensenellales bacterium]
MSAAGYRDMWQPAVPWGFPPLYEAMGLGWTLGHYECALTVSHGGMGLGWSAFLTLLPDLQQAAVLMCNAETPARSRIIRALLDTILGRPPLPGTLSWVLPLAKAYQTGGRAALHKTGPALQQDSKYACDPDDLVNLSHQLRSAGNERAWRDFLTFNLSLSPDHAGTKRLLQGHPKGDEGR